MLERDKTLNWWTGRISDQDLAEWTGMAPRAVGLVLGLPHLRAGVAGGGQGSRHRRRVDPKTRNAVAIIHALNQAGLTFELAANIISATPFLASAPTEVVDYSDIMGGVRSLMMVDPKGNWLPTDVVPWHVAERFVFPCCDVKKPNPSPGEVVVMDYRDFRPNDRGTMLIDRAAYSLPNIEIRPLTEKPVYAGEIDPLEFFLYENNVSDSAPQFDDHLQIINGRWVIHKAPEPSPLEAMQNFMRGVTKKERGLEYRWDVLSVIEDDRKTVRSIGHGRDEEAEKRAHHDLSNFDSLLDVNITQAVRKMKRRALGLPVGPIKNPKSWEERVVAAQRVLPPDLPAPKAMPEYENPASLWSPENDFFRKWVKDDAGNNVLVGLTKEETDWFEAASARDLEWRTTDKFPWPSVEAMHDEKDRWIELSDRHEGARLQRIGQEMAQKADAPKPDDEPPKRRGLWLPRKLKI